MMSQVVPTDALAGALALVQMALEPKAVKAALDKLAAAKADVDARLADLADRQAKFDQGKKEFYQEREAHAAEVKTFTEHARELEASKLAHENAVKVFGRAEQKHMEDAAAKQAEARKRDAGLRDREKAVLAQAQEVERREVAASQREQRLEARERALAAAEAEQRARVAKLRELLPGAA